MRARVGSRTDIGRARRRNEDSLLVADPLFAVADGMGGHQGGDVASALALEDLTSTDLSGEGSMRVLVDKILEANRRVLERGDADPSLRGMGTTLTALLTEGEKGHVAHVGDSRAYLLRDGNLQQLTEDHTLVQRMVREGRLSPQDAASHPQRSIVTRALGVEDELTVDELTIPLQGGDRLLLCTDGLTTMVPEARIQAVLAETPDPQAAADQLVALGNRAGGDDNITVIVVDFSHDGEEGGRPALDGHGAVAQPTSSTVGEVTDRGRSGPATAVAEPAVEERPVEVATPRRSIRWGRVALWIGVAVVVLGGAAVGARTYVVNQWYVGVSEGQVAIYNGMPVDILGFELSSVEETTGIRADDATRFQAWKDLPDGITAESLADARSLVEEIRRDVQDASLGPAG